jgi:hypothetical protein
LKHFWLAAHLLGFVLWMGGGFSAIAVGFMMQKSPRHELAGLARVQESLQRALILPGCMLAVVSGLILTLSLYGSATSAVGFPRSLMIMQGTGLVAAAVVLTVQLPTMTRLSRLDPVGEYGPLFDSLRGRARTAGMLSLILGLVALVSSAMLR